MSRNTRNLIVCLALCLISFALWYFEVVGTAGLIEILVVDAITFFAIRAAEKNVDKSNRDLRK